MNVAPDIAAEALPGPLPPGERILWAARPTPRAILRHLLRARLFLLPVAVLAAWPVLAALDAGLPIAAALPAALLIVPLALPVIGLAWLLARTVSAGSLYIVTDRRVVLHVGYVYTRTINIPLALIRHVAVRPYGDGTGDIQLDIDRRSGVGYAALVPHARLARLSRPTPLLRCVPDAERAAGQLVLALARRAHGPRPVHAGDVAPTGEHQGTGRRDVGERDRAPGALA